MINDQRFMMNGTPLYGAETKLAIENFPISGLTMPRAVIEALLGIKEIAARVNAELGRLDQPRSRAIQRAAAALRQRFDPNQFPVDIFQTGSGTSTNMNVNEVVATRASQLLPTRQRSLTIHPNDHVNLGQSSNDVVPTAIHLAALTLIGQELLPSLGELQRSLAHRARAFDPVVKVGRTHLVDATPIRLGQEFGGYARQIELGRARITHAARGLHELPLGGTAVGTGLNTHPDFARRVIERLAAESGLKLREARNHFEAQASKDAIVELSGSLKTLAVGLAKVANDLRWLASGPNAGLAEIVLPSLQAGSSIMPGKVNPVLCESVLQVAAHVVGADATITLAATLGSSFELNTMMPVIALRLVEMITFTAAVSRLFARRCVDGITANRARCEALVARSPALVTPLAPLIGYDAAAAIAREAQATGELIRIVAERRTSLSAAELETLLDAHRMTNPGFITYRDAKRKSQNSK